MRRYIPILTVAATIAFAAPAYAHTPDHSVTCTELTVSGVKYDKGGTVDLTFGNAHAHHTFTGPAFTYTLTNPTPQQVTVWAAVIDSNASEGDATYQGTITPCPTPTTVTSVTNVPSTSSTAPATTSPSTTVLAPMSTTVAPETTGSSTPTSTATVSGDTPTTSTRLTGPPLPSTSSATSTPDRLPATGFPIIPVAGIAILITVVGVGLYRSTRRA